eukprot:scaffold16702_cov20-Tisochrysis_lutea.AAC.4
MKKREGWCQGHNRLLDLPTRLGEDLGTKGTAAYYVSPPDVPGQDTGEYKAPWADCHHQGA